MWAYNETFYQIYPIGFCGAPTHNDGICVPRILKLKDWSSYLENLQIGSVLLNPIFESDNHGYDTRDFKKVDCRLGTNEDFQDVCDDLHKHHIKIVLDGVFNHVGRGFWAFQDVQEKKWDSPYKDWFYINFDGDSCYQDGFWYEGWEGHFELVKLNLQNPAVTDYLLDCVRFWIETFDIDGLRLDVAYSLDHNFMRRLRSFCEEQKPGFVLIGEVLFGDYNLIVYAGNVCRFCIRQLQRAYRAEDFSLRDCGGCRKGETGRKCLQENSRHYKLHGRGRQRPHEGNGAGELPAHQGRGEADCAGGTGAYQKRSGAV